MVRRNGEGLRSPVVSSLDRLLMSLPNHNGRQLREGRLCWPSLGIWCYIAMTVSIECDVAETGEASAYVSRHPGPRGTSIKRPVQSHRS